jgi:hypothetical protein
MQAEHSTKTLLYNLETTWCKNPEDHFLNEQTFIFVQFKFSRTIKHFVTLQLLLQEAASVYYIFTIPTRGKGFFL